MNEGNNYYSDEEFNELVNLISEAKNKFNLVVFIGAGVSLSQGYPNWSGYVEGLIHFWQFEIRNLLPDKNIITTNLITTFDEILKSSNNEKRKIDLLYTLLDENLGKKFENNQLDFEKFYFEKVVPKNVENIILTQLIRLDPIYITSNYDFEIEKHLRRFKQPGDYRTINNIHECSETKQLIANDVLHLHGTSEGSPDFFVRSSSDYSKLYLKKEPSDFKNLSQWFLEKKPLVLFLGSSMEEEEILSLLPSTTKNFALMRANSFETSYYRNIYNKMFQKNNQTTIFWYGDNYDSLPTFVKKLVDAIEDLQQTSEKKKDWDTLHSFLTSNESYEITLAKYINDSQFLDDLCQINDQALEQKLITIVLSNPLISDSMIKTFHFWELLERNFATLSEIQIDNVVSIYETKTFSLHRKSIFVIYEKIKTLDIDLKDIRINLSKCSELIDTPFSNDPELIGYWLPHQMKSELASYHHIYSKNTRIKINFTTNQIKQLTDLLSEKTFYLFSPIDEILENDTIKLLSTSLEYDLVDLNNNSIFINFPDNLLKTRLIQKLLVHIDNKQNINKTTLYKLISFIDFSDSIFGKELNEFVNSNKELLDKQNIIPLDEYTDGIIDPGAEYLSETSFIDNKQFLTEDFDTILTTLTQTEKEKTDDINSFSLKTINGTEKFLINSLNANNKISKIIEAFIIEKGGFLFPKYEGLFFKILNQETYSQNLKNEALAIILEKYQYDSFSSIEYDYFKSLIEKNEFDGDLFDRLLNIKVNYLDHEYVYRNIVPLQLIDINTFINTELGRFLDIIILFNKKNPKINNKTAKILLDIKDNKYREFTQGALFPTNNYIELKSITGNTFQGYSYYYKGFSKDSRKIFESTAKILLETGSVNSINEFNLFFLSLNIINPKVNKIKWEVINLSRMINISLQTKMDFEFEKLWIEEIFSNSSKSDIEFNLTYLLINKSVQPKKFKLLFNILKENIKNYSLNLDIEPIINSIGTNETNETNELLIDTFFLFLDSNKIKSTYYNLNSFKKLMNRLTPDKQKKLANHSHLSIILSIQDIDKIKRIID